MRQTVQNVGLLIIVGSLCAVFILQFGGPQAQGCSSEIGKHRFAAKVYGDTVSLGEMKSAYTLANGPRYSTQAAKQMRLKELVLEGLIERNLLARNAKELGFSVSKDDVMRKLAEDSVILVSAPAGAPASIPNGALPVSFEDDTGNFNVENARRFIQNRLGRSVDEFADSQVAETLAQRMREVVQAPVAVSAAEIWDAFVREREKADIKYVRFDAKFYEAQVTSTPATLEAFLKEHQKDVDAQYDKDKHLYTGLEKQVRARHILVKLPEEATEEQKSAAKAKAEAARQRALKGEDFAALARQLSDDTASAKQGGDLGYNTRGKMVAPFDDAQFAMKAGDLSEVVETRFGYHVIKVESVREGDVPVEEAKREIADAQFIKARALELARTAAARSFGQLKSGESLEQLEARLTEEKASQGESALAPALKDSHFSRGGSPIPGLDAGEVAKLAFELSEEKPLPDGPIKVDDSYVVFRLMSRERATKEAFAGTEEQRLRDALVRRKRGEVLDAYVRALRKKADAEGAVHINPDAVSYAGSEQTASL